MTPEEAVDRAKSSRRAQQQRPDYDCPLDGVDHRDQPCMNCACGSIDRCDRCRPAGDKNPLEVTVYPLTDEEKEKLTVQDSLLPEPPDPEVTWALEGLVIFLTYAAVACATGLVAQRMGGLEGMAVLVGFVAAFTAGVKIGRSRA